MYNIIEMIDRNIAELQQARRLLAPAATVTSAKIALVPTPTRIISASARKRMATAQKARWAKYRASKKTA